MGCLLRFGRIVEIIDRAADAPNLTRQQIVALLKIMQLTKQTDQFLQLVRKRLNLMSETSLEMLSYNPAMLKDPQIKNFVKAVKNQHSH